MFIDVYFFKKQCALTTPQVRFTHSQYLRYRLWVKMACTLTYAGQLWGVQHG